VLSRVGFQMKILSDESSDFMLKVMRLFMLHFNIRHVTI